MIPALLTLAVCEEQENVNRDWKQNNRKAIFFMGQKYAIRLVIADKAGELTINYQTMRKQ